MPSHFLELNDISADRFQKIVDRAIELKSQWNSAKTCPQVLQNRTITLIFDKLSTRTRVSFEVAASHLGGSSLFISPADSQLNRGESIADTAKVLSSMTDVVVIRTGAHSIVETFAQHSSVPVINGLSDKHHPCQLLADIQTWQELRGSVEGGIVAWLGDGNNVCHSWASAAKLINFKLRISTPTGYAPDLNFRYADGTNIELVDNPMDAVTGADVVVTDTWTSMGQEDAKEQRSEAFKLYQVTAELMRRAAPDAIFMHCLPAYRGYEVTAEVIDGPQSVVWQEAENRLHAQKALLEWLITGQ